MTWWRAGDGLLESSKLKAAKWKINMAKIRASFPFCPPRCGSQQGGVGMAGILLESTPIPSCVQKTICPSHAFLLPRLVEEIQGDAGVNRTIMIITQCWVGVTHTLPSSSTSKSSNTAPLHSRLKEIVTQQRQKDTGGKAGSHSAAKPHSSPDAVISLQLLCTISMTTM